MLDLSQGLTPQEINPQFLPEPTYQPISLSFLDNDPFANQAPGVPALGSAIDDMVTAPKSLYEKSAPVFFNAKELQFDRYKNSQYYKTYGLDLGGNNEEVYGQRQTWGDTMSNAFKGAGNLAWNGFVDGWKGWGRMGSAIYNLDFNKLHGDDASMMELNSNMEDIMNRYAIFNTEESENTFFNRKTLGNFMQQSGFTVGTIAQTVAEQLITKAIEAAIFVPTAGVGSAALEVAEDTRTALAWANIGKKMFNMNKWYKDLKKLGDIYKDEKVISNIFKTVGSKLPGVDVAMDLSKAYGAGAGAKQLAYIGVGGVKRLLSEGNLAFTEARMEAAGTYSDMYNKMYQDHVNKTGQAPTGEQIANIKKNASAAADDNFAFNSALLGTMNRIQFDNVFKSFKGAGRMGSLFGEAENNLLKVTGKAVGEEGDKILSQYYRKGITGQLGITGAIAKDFGKTTAAKELGFSMLKSGMKWEGAEGLQELLQEGSNNYFQDYYYNMYNNDHADKRESLSKAVDSQMNMQGLKTFMSGALTGMMISGPTHLTERAMQNMTAKQRKANKERNEETDNHLIEVNAVMKDASALFNESLRNLQLQNETSGALNTAAIAKNKFEFENIKSTALAQLVAKAVRTNTHEGLLDSLKDYTTAFSKEEFEKAFIGTQYTDDNKSSAADYVGKVVDGIESYVTTYNELQEKFGDKVNPYMYHENSKEYRNAMIEKNTLDHVIEKIAGNKFKHEDTLNRMTSIAAKAAADPAIGSSMSAIYTVLGSETNTAQELVMLREELKNLVANPTADRETTKLIKQTQEQIEHLEAWRESKDELLDEITVDKSLKAFKGYLASKNKEFGIDASISIDGANDHFNNLHDYVKLNRKAQDHTEAIDMLMNPRYFSKLHKRLTQGAHIAASRLRANVMTGLLYKTHMSIHAKPLMERWAALMKKESWTEEDFDESDKLAQDMLKVQEGLSTEARHTVTENQDGTFSVVSPQGNVVYQNAPTEEIAEELASEMDEVLAAEEDAQPAMTETPEAPKAAVQGTLEERRLAEIINAITTPITQEELEKTTPEYVIVNERVVYEYDKQLKKYVIVTPAHSSNLNMDAIARREEQAKDLDFFKGKSIRLDNSRMFWFAQTTGKSIVKELTGYKKRTGQGRIDDTFGQIIVDINAKYDAELAAATPVAPIETPTTTVDWAARIQAATSVEDLAEMVDDIMNDVIGTPQEEAIQSLYNEKIKALDAGIVTPVVIPVAAKDDDEIFEEAEEAETLVLGKDGLPFDAKPENPLSTTGKQTIGYTNDIDRDPVKETWYNTIKKLQNATGFGGRKGVKITAMSASKLFVTADGQLINGNNLEQNTLDALATKRYAIHDLDDSIVMVITDDEGVPYRFNTNGDYSETGLWAIANMRKPVFKDGRYELTGYRGDQVLSPAEIIMKMMRADKRAGRTLGDTTSLEKALDQKQQREFETLHRIRETIKADKSTKFIYDIKTISNGYIPVNFAKPKSITSITMDEFKPFVVTDAAMVAEGMVLGAVYFKVPGVTQDVLVVRPKISADLAETIVQLMHNTTNPLNGVDSLAFIRAMVYTKAGNLWFSVDPATDRVVVDIDGKRLGNDAGSSDILRRYLQNKKMNIDKSLIGENLANVRYQGSTFTTSVVPYNKFIQENYLTYLQADEKGKVEPVNRYVEFDAEVAEESGNSIKQYYEVVTRLEDEAEVVLPNLGSEESDLPIEGYVKAINGAKTSAALKTVIDGLPADFKKTYSKYLTEKVNRMAKADLKANLKDYNTVNAGGSKYFWKRVGSNIEILNAAGKIYTSRSKNYNQVVASIFADGKLYESLSEDVKDDLFRASYAYFMSSDAIADVSDDDLAIQRAIDNAGGLKHNKFSRAELSSAIGSRYISSQFKKTSKATVEDIEGFSASQVIDFLVRFPNGINEDYTVRDEAIDQLGSEVFRLLGLTPSKATLEKIAIHIPDPSEEQVEEYINTVDAVNDAIGSTLESILDNVATLNTDGTVNWTSVLDAVQKDKHVIEYLKNNEILEEFTNFISNEKTKQEEAGKEPVSIAPGDINLEEEAKAPVVTNNSTTPKTVEEEIDEIIRLGQGLNRSRSLDNVATAEQIQAAREWFERSPLSKYIGFKEMFDILNSNAFATWTQNGITLFAGSNYTDLYHEAWHGFTQLFMTIAQKQELYREVRKQNPKLTMLQAEELLAEDFRKYALSGAKEVMGNRPVRNTIFRRIWNFLKSLLGKYSYDDYQSQDQYYNNIEALYKNLYYGNLKSYSPSNSNAIFGKLNKGIESPSGFVLSNAESLMVSDTFDSLIRTYLQKIGKNVNILYENDKALATALTYVKAVFKKKAIEGNDYQRNIAQFVLDNFQESADYFASKSKYLKATDIIKTIVDANGDVIEKKEEGDDSASTDVKDNAFNRSGNEDSIKDLASPETLYLVSGLFQVTKDGKHILNELGEPKLVEFDKTWNRLIKTLQGVMSEKTMVAKLVTASETYPEFGQLIAELGDPTDFNGDDTKFNLWMKFRQDFSKTRIPIMEALIEEGNGGVQFKFTEARPDINKVKQQFTANFQSVVSSPYVLKNSIGENVLNIVKVLEDFTTKTVDKNGRTSYSVTDRMGFLAALGMKFSDKPEIKAAVANNRGINYLASTLGTLQASGVEVTSPIDQLSTDQYDDNNKKISKGESNNIKSLLETEVANSDDFSNYSVINPAGDKEWEHSLNNMITMVHSVLNDVTTYPTYQDVIGVEDMQKFDVSKNPMIRNSIWLNSLFDLTTGERRKDDDGNFVTINIMNLSGVKMPSKTGTASEGVKIASLDTQGKFLFDFNTLLSKGIIELPRHEAKNSYYGIKLSKIYHPVGGKNSFSELYAGVDRFISADRLHSVVYDKIKGYMIDELNRIGMAYQGVGDDIQIYKSQNKVFALFSDILTADTQAALIDLVKSGIPEDLDAKVGAMDQTLMKEFKSYFDILEGENAARLNKSPFVDGETITRLGNYLASVYGSTKYSELDKRAILNRTFTYNAWIANMEAIKFIYGDPAFYNLNKEEFHKRNAAAGATGTTTSTDKGTVDYVNSKGRATAKAMGIAEKQYDNKFDTVIFKDVTPDSVYLEHYRAKFSEHLQKQFPGISDEALVEKVMQLSAPYTKSGIKEGDAQGWITLDSYRIFKMIQGQWNRKMEDLYQRAAKGEEISAEDVLFFAPLKPQYFGPLKTDMLYAPAFHKFSLVPLIPSLIKGSNMESINKNLMLKGADYAVFGSGSKVAVKGDLAPFYTDQDARTPYDGEYTLNTVYARYLKEQVAIDPKWKKQVIFSTQLRKLVDNGLFENGKEKFVGAQALSDAFAKNISRLTELKKKKLMKETGIVFRNGKYEVTDFAPLVDLIKKEFISRELPDSVIDFISLTKENKLGQPLDLSTHTQKIESVLQSIVNNRLIRQKVNGESLIQLASTGFENAARFRKPTAQEQLLYNGTNDLPTYHVKADGKTAAAKVKIAMSGDFLKLLDHVDLEGKRIQTVERLNELIKNEDWLNKGNNRRMITLTGVRIPVQGLNSMEFMEVHHFLPSEAGNVIILPTEIVGKSGGDFDIDKLTTFKPNIKRTSNGKITLHSIRTDEELQKMYKDMLDNKFRDRALYEMYSEEIGEENMKEIDSQTPPTFAEFYDMVNGVKAVENDLINNMRAILEAPENFIDLITPNSTDLVEFLADKLEEKTSSYDAKKSKVTGGRTSKVSATRLLEEGYNLSKFESNNVGKAALGVGAVDNTFNALFNRVGAYMNQYYKDAKNRKVTVKIRLSHNSMNVNGQRHISISNLYDVDKKNKISDVISQLMNGWVDVGKKAWIFNINGSLEVSPVILLLNQAGTPISDIAHFVTLEPIVKYTAELRGNNNLFDRVTDPQKFEFFKSRLRQNIIEQYLTPDVLNRLGIYSDGRTGAKELSNDDISNLFTKERLEKDEYTQIEKALLLNHYFELEDLAGVLRDVKTSLNFDTSRAKNAIDSQNKINQYNEAVRTALLPESQLKFLRENSVISSFAIQDFSLDFQEELLPLRNHKVMNAYILKHQTELPIATRSKVFDKYARVFKNDFIQYLFQNYALGANVNINNMFYGDNTMADKLDQIKLKYPNLEKNYPLVKSLILNKSKKHGLLKNIRLNESSMDTDKINVYQDQFNKLIDPSVLKSDNPKENEEITKFFSNLAVFGFLQSGLNKSFLSITEVIPQSIYSRMMQSTIEQFTQKLNEKDLDNFNEFFRSQNPSLFGLGAEEVKNYNGEPHRIKHYRDAAPAAPVVANSSSSFEDPNSYPIDESYYIGEDGTVYDNTIGFKEEAPAPVTPPVNPGVDLTYTPEGKAEQTYNIKGTQIFNKAGVEVFKEDSVDRNKIFANLAVKQKRAVVVKHKDQVYVVNTKNQIISGKTGKMMQWDETNGDRKAIIATATPLLQALPQAVQKATPPANSIATRVANGLQQLNSGLFDQVLLDRHLNKAELIAKLTNAKTDADIAEVLKQIC